MRSATHRQTKALTRQDVVDLVRAGVILAVTVIAAMIVPPKVFGATRVATADFEQQ